MLVNSRFVVRKIGEDSKGTLCGSIGHQLNHDIVLSFGYRVGFLSVGQVIFVFFCCSPCFHSSDGILEF